MTRLQQMRDDLVVISGYPGLDEYRAFSENRDHFLWTDEYISMPIQLHYCPVPDPAQKGSGKGARTDARPVLLLHGASAGADTFLHPTRGGGCFVDYLIRLNYEPWLLDWRASKEVAEIIIKLLKGEDVALGLPEDQTRKIKNLYTSDSDKVFQQLNFNAAAEHDIRRAVAAIRAHRPGWPIDVVAHCMGSAITAEALVRGLEPFAENKNGGGEAGGRISHVVLSTIGVFYQMNAHGRLKAEAHLLKRVLSDRGDAVRFLDPRVDPDNKKEGSERLLPDPPWPKFIKVLYQAWKVPYDQDRLERDGIPMRDRPVFEMFNRLSFMFGEPYQEGNLAPEFHHRLQALTIEPLEDDGHILRIPAGSVIRVIDDEVNDPPVGQAAYDFESGEKAELLVCGSETDFAAGQLLSADGRLVGHIASVSTDDDMNGPLLPALFGPMSLDLFRHGAENLRAGIATIRKETENDDDGTEDDARPAPPIPPVKGGQQKDQASPDGTEDDARPDLPTPLFNGTEQEDRASFERLDRITLIGGGLNRLWHRDSIDRMADWLDRSHGIRETCRKTMLLDYGHQDLFWGRHSATAVFPKIVEGLGPPLPEDGQVDRQSDDLEQSDESVA